MHTQQENAASNSILVLFAHPSQTRSEVNLPLFRATQKLPGITCIDLYQEYPTYRINIDREQQRLRQHQTIIFMFPFYWYSTPALLKEWQDLVLEYGFAYGTNGNELQGKTFMCALTAGGSEAAYCNDGYNQFPVRELLRPLEQTATLTGMHYLAPFVLFGSRTAVEENRLETHIEDWRQILAALHENRLDLDKAHVADKLNDMLDEIKGAQQ